MAFIVGSNLCKNSYIIVTFFMRQKNCIISLWLYSTSHLQPIQPHYFIQHHITQHHIPLLYITTYHITTYHTTPHHPASHPITWHLTKPHCTSHPSHFVTSHFVTSHFVWVHSLSLNTHLTYFTSIDVSWLHLNFIPSSPNASSLPSLSPHFPSVPLSSLNKIHHFSPHL